MSDTFRNKAGIVAFYNDFLDPDDVLTEAELTEFRDGRWRYQRFVDAVNTRAYCELDTAGGRVVNNLRPGHVAVLIAAMFAEGRPLEFETLRLPNVATTDGGKKTFTQMRRLVDGADEDRRVLFKHRRKGASTALEHRFEPDSGVTWCFLFRAVDVDAVFEATLSKSPTPSS